MTRTLKISPDVDEHGSTKITHIATFSYPARARLPRFAPQDTGPPGPGWTTHPAADAPARAGAVRSETAPTWRELGRSWGDPAGAGGHRITSQVPSGNLT